MKQIVSNKSIVQKVLAFCLGTGMKDIIISPGSRNAPLTISFDECKEITSRNIPDERVAGFFALGISQAKNLPVALTCTSGSAVANYFPAVTEAYYRRIPLVIISADRPEKWINQGDGQTIMQKNIFGHHVGYSVEVSDEDTDDENRKKLEFAFQNQLINSLPIHINVHLDEPLYECIEMNVEVEKVTEENCVDESFDIKELSEIWNSTSKRMILIGQMNPNKALSHELKVLSEDTSTIVLVENLSNQSLPSNIHCIDRILNSISPENEKDFAPELLITLGDAIVSKRIKAFLRRNKAKYHWNVNEYTPEMNTYECLSHSITQSALKFSHAVNQDDFVKHQSNFAGKWKQLNYLIKDKHQDIIWKTPFSDLFAVSSILDCTPDNSVVHLSNSAVIRYAQLVESDMNIAYFGNRGTSGIDGSTSTALGSASTDSGKLNIFITGDISFMYDSNAFWNNDLPVNLICFVINNNGGGIFKIIDGPSKTNQLKKHFVAEHSAKIEGIANTFDVEYTLINSKEQLIEELPQLLFPQEQKLKIVEINTSSIENEKVLKDYFAAVKVN